MGHCAWTTKTSKEHLPAAHCSLSRTTVMEYSCYSQLNEKASTLSVMARFDSRSRCEARQATD